jgi:hypothetical protein
MMEDHITSLVVPYKPISSASFILRERTRISRQHAPVTHLSCQPVA